MRVRRLLIFAAVIAGLAALDLPRFQPGHAQSTGWHYVAPLPEPLYGAAAATGVDGKIYVFGGTSTTGVDSAQTYVYDPIANSWSTGAPLPVPITDAGAALGNNGQIYVIGGADDSGEPVNALQAYNPASNTWTCSQSAPGCASTSLAPLPTARDVPGVVAGPNGTIWALGGDIPDATGAVNPTASVEVYDTAGNAWTAGPELPFPSDGVSEASQTEAKVLWAIADDLMDCNEDFHLLWANESELEDLPYGVVKWLLAEHQSHLAKLEDCSFARLVLLFLAGAPANAYPPFVQTVHGHQSSPRDSGRIYIVGMPPPGGSIPSNSVAVWDIASKSFSPGPPLLQARVEAASATGADGTFYVIGGNDNDPMNTTVYSSVEAYTPPPPPPPPTSTPTDTPVVTATPAPTSTPTPAPTATTAPTSTPVPLFVHTSIAHKSIHAGQTQTISVHTLPGARVSFAIVYPDGKKSHHTSTANGKGLANWHYKQPNGRTSGKNHTVHVTVSASAGGATVTTRKTYTIG